MSKGYKLEDKLPCGCVRSVATRIVPAFDPKTGQPKLSESGEIVMEPQDEIVESYCDEHTGKIIERQEAVAKALADGKPAEEAMLLMLDASPFPQLTDGEGDGE